MTRSASTLDRLAALVFGLALIALGVGLLVWNTDWITGIPQIITAPGLVTAAETGWWPWAVAAAGIVLVAIALRWLFTHTPKAKMKNLRLSGGNAGSISADLGEVADAAARVLGQSTQAHSAASPEALDARSIENGQCLVVSGCADTSRHLRHALYASWF